MSDNTPTPIEVPLSHYSSRTGAIPTAYAQPDSQINISRLVLSAPMVAGMVLVLLSGVVSLALVWFRAENHQDNGSLHLHAPEVISGGGIAYQREVQNVYAKTRKLLKAMTISCKKSAEGMYCRVDLPEGD